MNVNPGTFRNIRGRPAESPSPYLMTCSPSDIGRSEILLARSNGLSGMKAAAARFNNDARLEGRHRDRDIIPGVQDHDGPMCIQLHCFFRSFKPNCVSLRLVAKSPSENPNSKPCQQTQFQGTPLTPRRSYR